MATCYVWQGTGQDNGAYCWSFCADNPRWVASPTRPGWYQPYDGSTPLEGRENYVTTNGAIIACTTQAQFDAARAGRSDVGAGCADCLGVTYDCINGECVRSNTYKTPGKYKSLEECQAACSVDSTECPPGFVCLEDQEYQQILGQISDLEEALS